MRARLYEAQGTEAPEGWIGIGATASKDEDDELPATPRGKKKKKKTAAKRAKRS